MSNPVFYVDQLAWFESKKEAETQALQYANELYEEAMRSSSETTSIGSIDEFIPEIREIAVPKTNADFCRLLNNCYH